MSEQNQASATPSYGYADDSVKVSPFNFGLNAGNTFLTKFEWIPNGGVDGAEQEAIDIIFKINDTDKSYRMFPVTKAFLKGDGGGETSDPNSPEMIDAFRDFNARIVHILHSFVSNETTKAALSIPITSFKQFAQIAMSLLPKNYKDIPLDIFLQFGWSLGDKERTYLEIPTKMKYGAWLKPAQEGTWIEHRVDNPTDSTREALYYTNENNEKHPFIKNGWFMNSNFASQQKSESSNISKEVTNKAATNIASDGAKKAATW